MRLRPTASLVLALCCAAPAAAQVTVRLTAVPAGTPANAPIFIAGSFNNWNPADPELRLTRQPNGEYLLVVPQAPPGPVEFKFTLGAWERVETDSSGGAIPNRRWTVPAGPATWTGAIAAWQDPAKIARRPHSARATVSVLDTAFAIPQLGRTRRVWIYLPPGYAASSRRYPVLYLHDGQNVFDDHTSYAGEWGVDETLDSLAARGDAGAIVVAVDNGPERMAEYSPWVHPRAGGGQGGGYVDFLAKTLKPYVDAHYRTRPGPESTGVLGSSMGGLISLYAGLKYPEVFGRVGVFSPSLWFSDSAFTLARAAKRSPGQRWYFVSGGSEGPAEDPGVVVKGQEMMVDSLAAAGFDRRTQLRSVGPADGKHSEWFWRREFPAAYGWLFSRDRGAER